VFRRYHIPTASAPSRRPWARVAVHRDLARCLNCGTCIDSCLYGVHGRRVDDPRFMAEPTDHLCRVCFRCVQECPVNALALTRNRDFVEAGNGLFTPHILRTLSNEAEGGRIPVTGACYNGPFGGPGFDGIWTDMSEIVRPTRDGIHGREYIATSVDIGFRPTYLDFSAGAGWTPPREIPIPMILDSATPGTPPSGVLASIVRAARTLGTYAIVPSGSPRQILDEAPEHVLVRGVPGDPAGDRRFAGLEVTYGEDGEDVPALRRRFPDAILSLRLPLASYDPAAVDLALDAGVDLVHFTCGWQEVDDPAGMTRYIRTLRDLHGHLLERSRRDSISVVASGPIAAAEHVPKTIILGADLVSVDTALYVVLECVPPNHAVHLGRFPEDFPLSDVVWGTQRIVNLMNAWRDQLLEILGAMGMREVRRLRGEVGRAIFQAEAEREAFGDIRMRIPEGAVAR